MPTIRIRPHFNGESAYQTGLSEQAIKDPISIGPHLARSFKPLQQIHGKAQKPFIIVALILVFVVAIR